MATFINHLPYNKVISGKEFFRGETYDNERDMKLDIEILRKYYLVRSFWTGGETLSDKSTRKTFFLMLHPKS